MAELMPTMLIMKTIQQFLSDLPLQNTFTTLYRCLQTHTHTHTHTHATHAHKINKRRTRTKDRIIWGYDEALWAHIHTRTHQILIFIHCMQSIVFQISRDKQLNFNRLLNSSAWNLKWVCCNSFTFFCLSSSSYFHTCVNPSVVLLHTPTASFPSSLRAQDVLFPVFLDAHDVLSPVFNDAQDGPSLMACHAPFILWQPLRKIPASFFPVPCWSPAASTEASRRAVPVAHSFPSW